MDKDALIERFWDLIEPTTEGYSKAIVLLLQAMPADALQAVVAAIDDPDACCEKCGAPCDRDADLCDKCEMEAT